MDDLLLFILTKLSHFKKAQRFIESFAQKWFEDFSKEMPTIQN